MIAHTEIFEVGRKNFTVNVEKKRGIFCAVCAKIPGLVTTGKTIKAAVDRFMYFSEPFFNDLIINLPLQERRKICPWMQDPEHPDYVSGANERRKEEKTSGSPPHRATEKTGASVGRFSPASLPYGDRSRVCG